MLQLHISWLGSWIIPMRYVIATYGPRTRELTGTSFKTLGHRPTWWPRKLPRILFLSPARILSSKTSLERSVDIASVKAIILTLLEFYVINTRLLLLWLTLTDLCEESQKTYRKKLPKLSWTRPQNGNLNCEIKCVLSNILSTALSAIHFPSAGWVPSELPH